MTETQTDKRLEETHASLHDEVVVLVPVLEGSPPPATRPTAEIRRVAELLKQVSDPTRLQVLMLLSEKERNVTELCADLGTQSQPAVSHHLALLRHGRLIEPRRSGKHNFYALDRSRSRAGPGGQLGRELNSGIGIGPSIGAAGRLPSGEPPRRRVERDPRPARSRVPRCSTSTLELRGGRVPR